ncbi:MAG: hypothetical protein RBS43_10555 [Candidatus Cloacimonas sp.]|jgi:hypothetical protein|nr:hypothetical protein [Candidatus Cloacimonas sp.]
MFDIHMELGLCYRIVNSKGEIWEFRFVGTDERGFQRGKMLATGEVKDLTDAFRPDVISFDEINCPN